MMMMYKKALQKEKEFWKLLYAEVVSIKVIELQKTEYVNISVILELLRKIFMGTGIDNRSLKYFSSLQICESLTITFSFQKRLGFKLATLPASMILLLKDRLESETEIWQVARLEAISVSNGQPSDTFPTLLGLVLTCWVAEVRERERAGSSSSEYCRTATDQSDNV